MPDYVDWDRWVGPAPRRRFHEEKLERDNHENITNFSLGMISCWGIHHLDIAQWGNGTDATGPSTIEGTGEFPTEGAFDAILRWKVRFEFANAAPVTFVNDGTPGFEHGIRFVGESGWVHVERGTITAHDEQFLRDPQNKYDTMPIKLPISHDHARNFVDAIKNGTRAICDIETAVRSRHAVPARPDRRQAGPQAPLGPAGRAVHRRRGRRRHAPAAALPRRLALKVTPAVRLSPIDAEQRSKRPMPLPANREIPGIRVSCRP